MLPRSRAYPQFFQYPAAADDFCCPAAQPFI
jgi:hypothetical protein